MRRLGVLIVASLLFAGLAASATDSARQLVINVSNQVIHALKKDPELAERDPNAIYKLLNRTVAPHFDFNAMAELVLGPYWRDADPQQRQRFTQEFRTHLVQFYALSLAKYRDQKIEYEPLRTPAAGGDAVVRTVVQQQNGPPIPIDYRMHREGGNWKVYDVIIDGVSMVATNRSIFAEEIRQGGIDKLTEQLAERNGQSGG